MRVLINGVKLQKNKNPEITHSDWILIIPKLMTCGNISVIKTVDLD